MHCVLKWPTEKIGNLMNVSAVSAWDKHLKQLREIDGVNAGGGNADEAATFSGELLPFGDEPPTLGTQ